MTESTGATMTLPPSLPGLLGEAWTLMDGVGRATAHPPPGITRAAYGEGEQLAMEAASAWAIARGLSVERDGYGNYHVTIPRAGARIPAVLAGSHLDSVPNGGNFDGLAGCAAALAVVAAVAVDEVATARPLRAILMRGEESPWFGTAYLGSRLMLGRSSWTEIGALMRRDSGRTLADHLRALGYDPAAPAVLQPADIACYFEMHIEQGPILTDAGATLGLARACRGNIRFPQARCRGVYGHSAALPRAFRSDAVLATADLALELDRFWAGLEAQGDDNFVVTIGEFATDAAQHAMTKVAGEVSFTLNIGATDPVTLTMARGVLARVIARIEQDRRVRFDLGPEVGTVPVPLDAGLRAALAESAAQSGVSAMTMPTVGHDAAMFQLSGIPAAVLLVRNAHGSHNPDETMTREDFIGGGTVLAGAMLRAAAKG